MRAGLAAAALIASSISSPALASDCSDAAERYNYALDEVSYALSRYTRCLNASDGQDDCSTEFRRLRYAQDTFESAVGEVQAYCEY
jgi:GH15 family glucan-1,4-alpha-glucosidase